MRRLEGLERKGAEAEIATRGGAGSDQTVDAYYVPVLQRHGNRKRMRFDRNNHASARDKQALPAFVFVGLSSCRPGRRVRMYLFDRSVSAENPVKKC